MAKKLLLVLICALCVESVCYAGMKDTFSNITSHLPTRKKNEDTRTREIKYQYGVLKDDELKRMEKKILNRTPSGYMTVEEYEALSEYKDRSTIDVDFPQIETPSDFKYIPKPLYSITKYNDPPGSVELSLGKRLFLKRQINAQGIVSPDYTRLVYPAVYYYPDSASVACDIFVIPLDGDENKLERILKANVARRNPDPILSTEKVIDNFAAFRTITPVDFSEDGTKILLKEKIGSSEDGIWQTNIHVYDFNNKVSYNLVELRQAIIYFWKEMMNFNLEDKRWDIIPLGFDASSPDRVVVQAYAYTGELPVFLGAWSIDWQGNQTRSLALSKNYIPNVSKNGYKVIKDGVESYQTVEKQEKFLEEQKKVLEKQKKEADKQAVKAIKDEFKYTLKGIDDDCKEELRDYKKLQSLNGSTEGTALEEEYNKYLQEQYQKDIDKAEKIIDKKKKDLEKIEQQIENLNTQIQDLNPNAQPQQESSVTPGQTE